MDGFKQRLEDGTDRRDTEIVGDSVATIDYRKLQVRNYRALTKARAVADKSPWIFVGHAVMILAAVTRNAESNGEAAGVIVTLYGYNGKDKPADNVDGIVLARTPAGENKFTQLNLLQTANPTPIWLRVAITTQVTDNNDYVDVDLKLVGA